MTQRSILITGCSSGIGRDAALTLHARGWQVFASCRRVQDCAEFLEMGIASPQLDYADNDSIHRTMDEVLTTTGGTLDALFNNGAFATPGALEDLPTDGLRAQFETGLFGWHEAILRAIPVMRAQGHGRIVNHSSVLGLVVGPWRGAYNSSKFALEGYTNTLRIEMQDTPIHVVLLNTGPIGTKIRENSIPHFEKWIDWRASARRDDYETRLIHRLYEEKGRDTFQLAPSAVTTKLIHAIESPKPRPRYHVTKATWLMDGLRRVLTTRALDRIVSKG